jgi:DNA (cytosine-5)-methyltransferase 1
VRTIKAGSMCSGYDGIDLALKLAGWDVETAWFAESDPDASRVLEHHSPGVPNLGDITKVDWADAEPVELLHAGFPCQPVSLAGRRKGTSDERWLWDDITNAIGRMVTRPRLCLFENVPGLLSANGGHAMARVVRGLAALGYVGRYRVLSAADACAPHSRKRVFVAAELADAEGVRHGDGGPQGGGGVPTAAVAGGVGDGLSLLPTPMARLGDNRGAPTAELAARRMGEEGRRNLDDAIALLPKPRATDGTKGGPGQRGSSGDLMLPSAVMLLPTPAARDAGRGAGWGDQPGRPLSETIHRLLPTPTAKDSDGSRNATANRRDPKPTTQATGWTLSDVVYGETEGSLPPHQAERLLPTPMAADGGLNRGSSAGFGLRNTVRDVDRWGQYGVAISRWEATLDRAAPEPTEPGRNGNPRLAPQFVEWLMGLPDGWVTAVPGLTRNAQLRILGNGVVPQQAALAVELLGWAWPLMQGAGR